MTDYYVTVTNVIVSGVCDVIVKQINYKFQKWTLLKTEQKNLVIRPKQAFKH